MKLKTGLKTLIGLSIVGILIATVLILTCPFAGVISFNTLVREGTKSYEELTVHATALPGVRELPAKVVPLFGTEVSFLGVLVLLGVILLSWLILKKKSLSLFGYQVTPRFMGLVILLITLWNLIFSAFLVGVEVIALHELWLFWLSFDATVVAMLIVALLSLCDRAVPPQLKSFESLEAWEDLGPITR